MGVHVRTLGDRGSMALWLRELAHPWTGALAPVAPCTALGEGLEIVRTREIRLFL